MLPVKAFIPFENHDFSSSSATMANKTSTISNEICETQHVEHIDYEEALAAHNSPLAIRTSADKPKEILIDEASVYHAPVRSSRSLLYCNEDDSKENKLYSDDANNNSLKSNTAKQKRKKVDVEEELPIDAESEEKESSNKKKRKMKVEFMKNSNNQIVMKIKAYNGIVQNFVTVTQTHNEFEETLGHNFLTQASMMESIRAVAHTLFIDTCNQ